MNRYTVIQPPWVENQLTELWLNAVDKKAVTAASDLLDQDLRVDAENKGEQVDYNLNLRKLIVGPLWVYFTVEATKQTVPAVGMMLCFSAIEAAITEKGIATDQLATYGPAQLGELLP